MEIRFLCSINDNKEVQKLLTYYPSRKQTYYIFISNLIMILDIYMFLNKLLK